MKPAVLFKEKVKSNKNNATNPLVFLLIVAM